MNSYVGMTTVKKEQGLDDLFNQQSILFTLPAYISVVLAGNVKSILCCLKKSSCPCFFK